MNAVSRGFAVLTQRSHEAEEAWRRRLAAEKDWAEAQRRLNDAWAAVQDVMGPPSLVCNCGDVFSTPTEFHQHLHLSHPEEDHE